MQIHKFTMEFNWIIWSIVAWILKTVSCEMPHHRAPIFTFEPPSLNVFSNSTGSTIPCNADGRPSPIIRWLKHDGLPALDLSGLRHVRHDGALVFPPFPAEDYRADVHATVYRCEVSNSVGTLGSRDVHVRAVVNQKYEIRLSDEFVLRGNMALLRCPVPSFVSDYVKVTSWERIDGFLITPGIISGKYGILQNGDLYIRDTTEHDSAYSFRCHTENTVTREKKVSTNYAKVIVTEPHHNQPPRIMIRSSRVSVPVGRKATLSCLAQGHPVPTYRWHKVAGELRSVPELGSTVRQEGGVLVFHKVVPADGGTYICEVSNSVGQDKVEAELIIEEPIHVSIYPPEQKLDVGKTANFNCSIQGHPIVSITWRKDMRTLSSSQRIIIPTPTSLQVRQVKRSDSGIYQCFVNRDEFSVQASAKLTIGDLAPKFTVTFPEKILRPGSYVSLVCVASGNPAPQIKWYLDGIWPVSTRPGTLVSTYLSSSGEVVSYLNFTSIDVSDSGLYQCEAFNEAGSVQHSKRLNVFGPLFIRPLSNLTALADSRFAMYCPFGGFPFDNVIWKREGRILPVNQRQRVYPNGTLVIEGVQPRVDDGRYNCEVTSSQGIPVSRSFRILVRTGPKVASFSFKDNLHEGMLTAVTCIVDAGDGPLTTRWLKDGQILLEEDLDATIMYAQEGHVSTLTIKKLEHKHNGNYTCASTNDVATGSYSAFLTVKVQPRWILEPSDITAVSGRPATISCQADGEPHPHIRWKKTTDHPPDQFKTIVSSSHVHILVNGSLNFPSVEASDEGYYLCEANNGVGPGLSTVVKLTVHSAPQFQFKFKVLGARRGDKTVLECSSYGNRPMNFIWRRQGVIIDPISEPRYRILEEELLDGDRSKLIIEKAERKDSALFTCTAVNDYGEDSLNIQLTVQDIPDAPQNLEIHDISSRTLRLTWNKPFDGNSPILQYTVMWRNVNDDNAAGGPVTVPGTETTVTIRSLKPKTRYFFRVKCQNSLGESQFGAEVAATTLEEPPRHSPENIKASVVSSRSINITWNMPTQDEGGNIEGFYVGYKLYGSSDAYTFKPVESSYGRFQHVLLSDLNRFTEYSIVVQSFNSRGAGPPSEEIMARTLEFDPPGVPVIKTYYATSSTIKVSWELSIIPSAPVTGYILHHKLEDQHWHDTHLSGDQSVYTLKDLQCGSTYYIYLVAFNSVSHGNSSEIVSAKTNGNAPIAPDKRMLLSVNKTTVTVNLNSWHNGGCPITFFIIQYKAAGHQEWTLVSNNIIPEQQTITITDLNPGTWYSILMTARNDAGATDAEYVFATLTLTGEYPPRPSEMSDVNGSFYRHLTITVPVISSTIVLVAVLCVVCIITRRRTSGRTPRTPDGTNSRDPSKPDSMPLSVTYDSSQEPTYYPSPYATSNTAAYNREQCFQSNHQQNTGTIGSTKCGYSYDVPYLQRREEKFETSYQSSIVYLPAYHRTGHQLLIHQEQAIYEIPDLGRRKQDCNRSSRENGYRRSSIESDDENEDDLILTSKDRIFGEEARESETECDRLWKNFPSNQYEEGKRWSSDRERVLLT